MPPWYSEKKAAQGACTPDLQNMQEVFCMKKMWGRMKKYPNLWAFAGCIMLGILTAMVWIVLTECWRIMVSYGAREAIRMADFWLYMGAAGFWGTFAGIFLIHPLSLTIFNMALLFRKGTPSLRKKERNTEIITILLGVCYTFLYDAAFNGYTSGIQFRSDWQEVLYRGQLHTPVWTEAALTVIVLSCVGIAGYLLLKLKDINRMPPLLTVLGISSVYIGILMCVLWTVQVSGEEWLFGLFPLNCILIGAKTVRRTVETWREHAENRENVYQNGFLGEINRWLLDSAHWPAAAFVLMLPLLGTMIGILVLFGQRPDSVIRAWTETSDWSLSQRTAPPSVSYDEHYLCTVAAQGHPGVVKPIRSGIRHGHQVTVNRQLCIANAFEQVLEERAAWLHGPVRRFYDRYGFPVARLIRSEYAADIVYYVMKPLEWLFLAVLYLVDEKPENRIAVQYPHAPVPVGR